jgi:hypothetical protein
MNSTPMNRWQCASCMLMVVGASGCAATSMLGRSTRALENTAKSMDQTRGALRQSDVTMQQLVSTLGSLRGPMEKLSGLSGPMRNLGALEPQMERLGTRLEGVEANLERLERPLENVAALQGPLEHVRALEKPLQTIANVAQDEKKLWTIGGGFLVAWAVAMFLAVYGGFVLALRRNPLERSPLPTRPESRITARRSRLTRLCRSDR